MQIPSGEYFHKLPRSWFWQTDQNDTHDRSLGRLFLQSDIGPAILARITIHRSTFSRNMSKDIRRSEVCI